MHYANNRSSIYHKITAMQITKKALRIWCVVLGIFLIGGTVSSAILSKKISEKRKIERLEAAFEKAVEKEYQYLLSEYNRLVDIVDNWGIHTNFGINMLCNLIGYLERQNITTDHVGILSTDVREPLEKPKILTKTYFGVERR